MATKHITIAVPDTVLLAEKTDEQTFAREVPVLAAVKLYELGRLSSGRAAELAGMSRVEFLQTFARYHVFPLDAELQDLEAQDAERHQEHLALILPPSAGWGLVVTHLLRGHLDADGRGH